VPLKIGTDFGATEAVPNRAALALFTARARPAVRAMPRVKIIEGNLEDKDGRIGGEWVMDCQET
jgi:hypothetical protein